MITYKIQKSSQKDLFLHLEKADAWFVPRLSLKVNLNEYADKIFNHAVTFEAWKEYELIGLIAMYCNDTQSGTAFITNVSVLENYSNQGIASRLMQEALSFVTEKQFEKIRLEVHPDNNKAIDFYKKKEFKMVSKSNDTTIMEYSLKN